MGTWITTSLQRERAWATADLPAPPIIGVSIENAKAGESVRVVVERLGREVMRVHAHRDIEIGEPVQLVELETT